MLVINDFVHDFFFNLEFPILFFYNDLQVNNVIFLYGLSMQKSWIFKDFKGLQTENYGFLIFSRSCVAEITDFYEFRFKDQNGSKIVDFLEN